MPKKKAYDWGKSDDDPIRSLFRAVLTQMYMDLGSKSRNAESQYAKMEAENFMRSNSRDFHMICDMADIHPDTVKRIGKMILENGLKWRAEAGKGIRYHERREYRRREKERKQYDPNS